MDLQALRLSLELAALTMLTLLPIGVVVGRWLAVSRFRGRRVVEALLALPLLLPPTVLGFYLLLAMGAGSPLGALWSTLFGRSLAFSFQGLLLACVIANIPFAIQPMQRAFESIGSDVREAAAVCGMTRWRTLWRIELPLAWPGILSALVLTFAHTLGEFGVVLMVGGSIPGETKTLSIAIYDRVQAFDERGAAIMAAALLAISLAAIATSYLSTHRFDRGHG
jgi:molybdate transport system permease protein